jgi:hypothetical protein
MEPKAERKEGEIKRECGTLENQLVDLIDAVDRLFDRCNSVLSEQPAVPAAAEPSPAQNCSLARLLHDANSKIAEALLKLRDFRERLEL